MILDFWENEKCWKVVLMKRSRDKFKSVRSEFLSLRCSGRFSRVKDGESENRHFQRR